MSDAKPLNLDDDSFDFLGLERRISERIVFRKLVIPKKFKQEIVVLVAEKKTMSVSEFIRTAIIQKIARLSDQKNGVPATWKRKTNTAEVGIMCRFPKTLYDALKEYQRSYQHYYPTIRSFINSAIDDLLQVYRSVDVWQDDHKKLNSIRLSHD